MRELKIHSSGPFHTAAMSSMADVRDVCASVMGYQRYVPCRICTAFVPRFELTEGLLPEETHHDAATLQRYFKDEGERRKDLGRHNRRETVARINAELCGWQHTERDTGAVRKKPAAASQSSAALRKKPAASTSGRSRARRNQRAASTRRVKKKPAASSRN